MKRPGWKCMRSERRRQKRVLQLHRVFGCRGRKGDGMSAVFNDRVRLQKKKALSFDIDERKENNLRSDLAQPDSALRISAESANPPG